LKNVTCRNANVIAGGAGRALKKASMLLVAAAPVLSSLCEPASGASNTWSGGGSGAWTDSNDWVSGIIPGSSTVVTSPDVALFNGAGGKTTITVDTARNIDGITFDTANAAAYSFNSGNLLLTNGGQVQMTASVVNPEVINSNVVAEGNDGSSITLTNNANSSSAILTVNGGISPSSPSGAAGYTTVYLNGTNSGANLLDDTISNSLSGNSDDLTIAKVGTGSWTMNVTQNYSGPTYVYSGTLNVIGTADGRAYGGPNADHFAVVNGTLDLPNTVLGNNGGGIGMAVLGNGSVNISGSTSMMTGSSMNIYSCGSVSIDNTGTLVNNRLGLNSSVYLFGGQFNYTGGAGNNSESVSSLTAWEGANAINLTPNAAGETVVSADSINCGIVGQAGPTGTVLATGYHLGAAPGPGVTNLTLWNDRSFGGNAGSTGVTPGTVNLHVLSWMVGGDLALSGNSQYSFVCGGSTSSYLSPSTGGVRPLDINSEYAHSIDETVDVGTAYRNISLTNAAIVNNAGTTINSLRLDTSGSVGGLGTLTVASGGVLALPGNAGISVANLNFGTVAGYVATIGDLSVAGDITGTNGLVKTGTGTLSLGANTNLPSGGLTVNQGVLKLAASNQLTGAGIITLAGGSIGLNGFSQTFTRLGSGALAGLGSAIGNPSSSPYVVVTVDGTESTNNNQPLAYLGTFGGSAGKNLGLVVDAGVASVDGNRDNVFPLSSACTYTGSTAVSSGELDVDFLALLRHNPTFSPRPRN
jgi:autotransporter-associated beta strand protein